MKSRHTCMIFNNEDFSVSTCHQNQGGCVPHLMICWCPWEWRESGPENQCWATRYDHVSYYWVDTVWVLYTNPKCNYNAFLLSTRIFPKRQLTKLSKLIISQIAVYSCTLHNKLQFYSLICTGNEWKTLDIAISP